jgi:hypothetical protein
MPSKTKQVRRKQRPAELESHVLELIRGGKAVPENLVQRHLVEAQKKRQSELERVNRTRHQMAKHLGRTQKACPPEADDPKTQKALDGLLGIHQKLAAKSLAAPKVPTFPGGILAGGITAKVVPPFDYDVVIPGTVTGEPTATGSSNKITGEMSASCFTTDQPGFNMAGMYTTTGIYFHPLTSGTLTVTACPTYSFQWWTNSLLPSDAVNSFGVVGLTVYGVDLASQTTGGTGAILTTAAQEFYRWDESNTGQIHFDFGFDLQTPLSVELSVTHNLVYLIFVDISVAVHGLGWPGSLAGAMISATVPSITYNYKMQQVFAPE